MKTNRQIAILISVFILILLAVAGFVFVYEKMQKEEKTLNLASQSFVSKNNLAPADLFLDFKDKKEKIVESYKNLSKDPEKPQAVSSTGKAFCWNDLKKTYEEVNLDPQKQIQKTSDLPDKFSKTVIADLDGNKIDEEYKLQKGKLIVIEDSKIIWQSDDNWWVDNFALADSNNDGAVELNLSVWKSGNFGPSKPFWVKENDPSVKNHFFVFGFKNGKIKPEWQSSNLYVPNCDFTFADLDGDSKNELLVLEGDYADSPDCKGKYVAVWKWNEWGFVNEWRSEEAEFEEMGNVGAKKCMTVF